ncbi:uncharacterized protein LOC134069694 [Sardina pilchardus]|uniref:uncharacterized protein LOC134069694 n=1 Tax=Sardina pilchardus TaxID=27697 RepID=UPI002E10C01D
MKHLTMVELIQTCDRISSWVYAATKEVILPAITKYEAAVHINGYTPCPIVRSLPNTVKMAEKTPTRKMELQTPGEILSLAVRGARSKMQEAASLRRPLPVQRVLLLEYQAARALQVKRDALRLEGPAESGTYGRSRSTIDEENAPLLEESLTEEAAITADSIFTLVVSMAPSGKSHLEGIERSDMSHSVPLAGLGKVFVGVQRGAHHTFPRALSCRVYQMLLDTLLGKISSIPDCQTKPILEEMASHWRLHKVFFSSVLCKFMERAVKSLLELFLGFPETPRQTGELREVYWWIYGDGRMSSASGTMDDDSSFVSESSLLCHELEVPETIQDDGDGQRSFASGALDDSSLWSVSSLLGRHEREALEALTGVVVSQARDDLRNNRQRGTASVFKRSNSKSVANNPPEPGKEELPTVPQVSSSNANSGIPKMCDNNVGSQDTMMDVGKSSSSIPSIPVCPEEQKGTHVCDSGSGVGQMQQDEKTPSSPKVCRTKRFRLFSSKRHNKVLPVFSPVQTNSKKPSFFSRMSTALSKAFCFK